MTGTEKYLKHYELRRADLDANFNNERCDYTCQITKKLVAQVVDMADGVIVNAIIKYATESGATDLFLIDKDFIMSAIKREILYRKAEMDLRNFHIEYGVLRLQQDYDKRFAEMIKRYKYQPKGEEK